MTGTPGLQRAAIELDRVCATAEVARPRLARTRRRHGTRAGPGRTVRVSPSLAGAAAPVLRGALAHEVAHLVRHRWRHAALRGAAWVVGLALAAAGAAMAELGVVALGAGLVGVAGTAMAVLGGIGVALAALALLGAAALVRAERALCRRQEADADGWARAAVGEEAVRAFLWWTLEAEPPAWPLARCGRLGMVARLQATGWAGDEAELPRGPSGPGGTREPGGAADGPAAPPPG